MSTAQVIVPRHEAPRHLRLTQGMIEDLVMDPVMAIWVFFRIRLDAFQAARARIMWFTPDVIDSSGFSTGKTFTNWALCQLRCLLIPDHRTIVVYQTFQTGKDQFWAYYSSHGTPLFRSQLGRFAEDGAEEGKARSKEPSSWKMHFRNGGVLSMPAPGVYTEGKNLASLRCNTLLIDEWTKIVAMNDAIFKQLLGRPTRESFNKEHPVWANKVWRTATAETASHPAARDFRNHERRQKRGDPDVYCMAFSYKDYSGLKSSTGKSFRDQYRDDKRLRSMRDGLSKEQYIAEGLGLWGGQMSVWYSDEMLAAMVAIGLRRGVTVATSRAMDRDQNPAWSESRQPRYFLGVDPAPAQSKDSDEGAISVLRALPIVDAPTQESDFQLDYIYGRVVRGHDIEAWCGLIHEKHGDFGFDLIVLDWGGGGQWMQPELKKTRAVVAGVETKVTPIVRRDSPEIEGQPILCVILRSDAGMQVLWPDQLKHARGDDVLKSLLHVALHTAVEKGVLGVPARHEDLEREAKDRRSRGGPSGQGTDIETWSPEKVAASVARTRALNQMSKFGAATRPDGGWLMTSNGAHIFVSGDKDDLIDADRNAYAAFRVWWAMESEGGFAVQPQDAGLCF